MGVDGARKDVFVAGLALFKFDNGVVFAPAWKQKNEKKTLIDVACRDKNSDCK